MASQLEASKDSRAQWETEFQDFLKVALLYMTEVSRSHKGDERVMVKFSKALLLKTYEIFDKVSARG